MSARRPPSEVEVHEPVPSPDRRLLLAGAATLAGAGVLSGCRALGRRPVPRSRSRVALGPDEAIRVGVIGTGGMGTAHCHSFLAMNAEGRAKVQIVALADVAEPRLEDAAEACDEKQDITVATYTDYDDLLARDDLHAVLIASPEHWHARMAVDAIAAGKDVYLEKPMTLGLEEALWLKDVVEANDCRLQVGTQKTMIPRYLEARKLILEGLIGEPIWSQTSYCRNSMDGEWNYYEIDERVVPGETLDWEAWCGPLGEHEWDPLVYFRWRRYRTWSTGIVGDLLVHVMTPLAQCVDAGWPVRVTAAGGHHVDLEMQNHDQVNMTVEFETGHTMVVAGSTCNENGLETLVRCHKGNVFLGSNDVVMRPERIWVDEVDERRVECEGVHDQDELRLDWLRCIRTRESVRSPVDLGAKVMVAVDLATRSMWEGSAFTFDPETRKVRRA
jgi:predicted dehydrogenase